VKPKKQPGRLVIDSAKLIHEFSIYFQFDRSVLLDMFAANDNHKELFGNKRLQEFLSVIYRKTKSKLKLNWVST
jgi:hypothetical protein